MRAKKWLLPALCAILPNSGYSISLPSEPCPSVKISRILEDIGIKQNTFGRYAVERASCQRFDDLGVVHCVVRDQNSPFTVVQLTDAKASTLMESLVSFGIAEGVDLNLRMTSVGPLTISCAESSKADCEITLSTPGTGSNPTDPGNGSNPPVTPNDDASSTPVPPGEDSTPRGPASTGN